MKPTCSRRAKPILTNKPGALAIRGAATILLAASILLVGGCAHLAVTEPTGPGGAIQSVDATGVTFTDQGKDLWIRESVPAEWFQKTDKGWHLSNLYWHAGNSIRLRLKNP